MSKFHLPYPNYTAEFNIDFKSKLCFLGSCFSDHIGQLAHEHGFNVLSNPFGTTFHPQPIIDMLRASIDDSIDLNLLDQNTYVTDWGSAHRLQSETAQAHEDLVISKRKQLKQQISGHAFLFITFGTSIGYRHKTLNKIVANCHKQPSELFKKETTSINQIYESWDAIIEELHTWNPDLNIIFTVSPVRHIKDGLIANNRSKSRLSAAIELLERKKNISYFPSFEFINDVLRDYRFFNTDLIHPSDQAINEVWRLFDQAYLNRSNSEISQKIAKLNKAKRHKEMNKNTTESEKHQAWIEKQNLLIHQLLNQSS